MSIDLNENLSPIIEPEPSTTVEISSDNLSLTEISQVEKAKKISKIFNTVRTAIALAIFVPFTALVTIGLIRNIQGFSAMAEASTGEYGGEFDPAMGAEVHSENGKALIVVHEGFGLDTYPSKYENDEDYQAYLRILEATKSRYLENGDVVVMVYDQKAWTDTDHKAQNNVLQFSTQSNNGFPNQLVMVDGVTYNQSYDALFDALNNAGVNTVEMAGEFRGACVSQVARSFKDAGYEMGWCAECAFPSVDKMNSPEKFPTLQPVSPNQYSPLTRGQGLVDQNRRVSVQANQWKQRR
ncbi:MAG: hypothetical protein ABII80_03745 [bacterium]